MSVAQRVLRLERYTREQRLKRDLEQLALSVEVWKRMGPGPAADARRLELDEELGRLREEEARLRLSPRVV